MGKQYQKQELKRFSVRLDEFIDEELPELVNKVKKKVAEELLYHIVYNEGGVPFKTGSYILSHRVGIGEPDDSDTIVEIGTLSVEAARTIAMTSQKPKIEAAKPGESIFISNSVGFSNANHYSWAANVEYEGWPMVEART